MSANIQRRELLFQLAVWVKLLSVLSFWFLLLRHTGRCSDRCLLFVPQLKWSFLLLFHVFWACHQTELMLICHFAMNMKDRGKKSHPDNHNIKTSEKQHVEGFSILGSTPWTATTGLFVRSVKSICLTLQQQTCRLTYWHVVKQSSGAAPCVRLHVTAYYLTHSASTGTLPEACKKATTADGVVSGKAFLVNAALSSITRVN